MGSQELNSGYFSGDEPDQRAIEQDRRKAILESKIASLKKFEPTGDYYSDYKQILTLTDNKPMIDLLDDEQDRSSDHLRAIITRRKKDVDQEIQTRLYKAGFPGAGPGSREQQLSFSLMTSESDALERLLNREATTIHHSPDAETSLRHKSDNTLDLKTVKEWSEERLAELQQEVADLTGEIDHLRRQEQELAREAIGIAKGLGNTVSISERFREIVDMNPHIAEIRLDPQDGHIRLAVLQERLQRVNEGLAKRREKLELLQQNIKELESG